MSGVIRTMEIESVDKDPNDRVFTDYDSMYNWWHKEDSSFDELTDNEMLKLIRLCDFVVLKSEMTRVEQAERQFHVESFSFPQERNWEEYKKELQEFLAEVENPDEIVEVYHLEDLQGGNLANIESETFDRIRKICERLADSYFYDVFSEY